ncbi:AAA family ATPase [Deinococcus sp. SDU3-2]|uniref:AAA family ATPase n=1 Tax=Deinococcus terrestris TaxID=2651870 RepID=A0A7X1TR38_9DEIO|nr:BTAD domain-containing putative transcriptional regulator [Deinococcus terrestris]MPY66403.1 AAA family ATPase [Deinococcus terrestris]
MSSAAWHLAAFGKPRLLNPSGEVVRCEARTLALLTYLALEGPTSRSRLAGLLWPDTPEAAARNNLVHLLRRVAKSHHPDLVQAGEAVALGGGLESDVGAWGGTGASGPESVPGGVLLDGLAFDDQPDLAEWLLAWRERLDLARSGRLAHAATVAEEAGDLEGAIRLARDLIDLDPLSEDAHRRLMRLLYLAGDRPAALKAYHRCRDVLERNLGVEPLPETRELARLIDRGAVEAPSVPKMPTIPLSVLRPPVLVGREREWARMEQAWERGQCILLVGPAGTGKTRLMQDFLASKGTALWLEARPGDAQSPYAATARMVRRTLGEPRDLEALPPWARQALYPLVPELLEPPPHPAPPEQVVAAIHLVYGLAMRQVVAVAYEDTHFTDAASRDAGFALLSEHFPLGRPGGLPWIVCTLRGDELSAEYRAMFEGYVAAGQAEWIDLEPLPAADAEALIASLEVPGLVEVAPQLARFAGGTPLFVLETIKHMIESGHRTGDSPFPVSGRVSGIIARRLSGLSTSALQAARAAAILASDFDLELVADTLRAPLLDVAAAWEELEAAQVMVGERFGHDLLAETLRADMPEGVRRLLHRAAARTLGAAGRAPARVADHWMLGGDAAQAAPWFLKAGHAAWQAARQREAADFFAQAAEHFAPVDRAAAFGALALRAEVLANMDDPRHADAVRALHERAVTPLERATAHMQEYRGLEGTMDVARIGPVVRAGLLALRAAEEGREAWLVEAQLTEGLALVAYLRGQREETLTHLRRLDELGKQAQALEWQAKAQEGLGLALSATAPREASLHLERAEALHLRRGDLLRAGSSLAKLARVLCELGEVDAARQATTRGAAHLGRLDANHGERVALLNAQIVVAQSGGDLGLAQALYEQARRDHTSEHNALLDAFPVLHAKTLRLAGRPDDAWAEMRRVRDGRAFPVHLAALRALEEAAILLALGRNADADAPLAEAESQLRDAPNVAWEARLHDLWALRRGQEAGGPHREAARVLRERHGLPDRHWSAL